jgi:hypothetical protein
MAFKGEYVAAPGLDEFIHDLGLAPERMHKAEILFERAAANTLVQRAKEMAIAEGSTAKHSAKDIKRSGTAAVFGGEPYDFGAEFGAIVYKQFRPWTGNGDDAGYFFYPAVRTFRDEDMVRVWEETVWEAIKEPFSEGGRVTTPKIS